MTYVRVPMLLAVLLLSGCANLSTIGRRTEIAPTAPAEKGGFAGGLAIHLDASQRLFYQAGPHFCAEPMPDALQSLASSSGVGAGGGNVSAAVSSAFSANAASIGLHTQSTTLMRDQYYRICELAANTNMTAPQVAQLMERAQRYTLGILAVEQLTGAVVGQQAALTADANSTAAFSLGATATALNQAQAVLADKKAAATAAASAASAADANATASAQVVSTAGASATDAQKTQANADKTAATKADADATSAASDQADAQTTVDALKKSLGTADAKATAAASGGASFGASATHSNIDDATASAIANATQSIVQLLLNRGDIVDSCMAMMMSDDADNFFAARKDLRKSCADAIQTSASIAAASGVVPFHVATQIPLAEPPTKK